MGGSLLRCPTSRQWSPGPCSSSKAACFLRSGSYGTSCVPRSSLYAFAPLLDPGGTIAASLHVGCTGVAHRPCSGEASTSTCFRGSMTQPLHRCLRFTDFVLYGTHFVCKVGPSISAIRIRLASGWASWPLSRWDSNPQDDGKRFLKF